MPSQDQVLGELSLCSSELLQVQNQAEMLGQENEVLQLTPFSVHEIHLLHSMLKHLVDFHVDKPRHLLRIHQNSPLLFNLKAGIIAQKS